MVVKKSEDIESDTGQKEIASENIATQIEITKERIMSFLSHFSPTSTDQRAGKERSKVTKNIIGAENQKPR
jgi:hypothetical protein